ncbi:hypothetical protein POM88_002162 [Heracleum sosnowskyi]|uniref:Post-SET domain-containing protein n=1 Tax=Heracleum sosnowskyi TaxID=360622 RepID=A0AAD8NB13_9APIA|nr:hypothetical protein POM88_002162 [Heracleum sosnowskyi]
MVSSRCITSSNISSMDEKYSHMKKTFRKRLAFGKHFDLFPNCYSRIITVNGEEHVIIFAKRDIEQWEELTYNYRFLSVDEQLACYCGVPSCRGVVNDIKAVEQVDMICVPHSE